MQRGVEHAYGCIKLFKVAHFRLWSQQKTYVSQEPWNIHSSWPKEHPLPSVQGRRNPTVKEAKPCTHTRLHAQSQGRRTRWKWPASPTLGGHTLSAMQRIFRDWNYQDSHLTTALDLYITLRLTTQRCTAKLSVSFTCRVQFPKATLQIGLMSSNVLGFGYGTGWLSQRCPCSQVERGLLRVKNQAKYSIFQ